jgi:hypothetical protein
MLQVSCNLWLSVYRLRFTTHESKSTNSNQITCTYSSIPNHLPPPPPSSPQPTNQQDDSDGLCMGPMGTFSQCGDVTLWYIRESTFISKRRRRRRATQLAYALQYSQQTEDGPCLQFKDTSNSQSQKKVAMGSCHASLDRVFAWTVNGRGVLHREVSSSSSKRLLAGQQHQHHQSPQCLWRVNNNVTNTNTHLAPCHPADNDNNNNKNEHVDRRLAHLSLVRYQPASVVHERTNRILAAERERIANETRQAANATTTTAAKEEEATVVVIIEESDAPEQQQHIPRYKDRARSHASQPLQHATVKSSSNKRMGSVVRSAAPEETKEPKKRSIFTLQDTNPILFLGDSLQQEANKKQQQQQQQQQQPKNNNKGAAASNHKLVHSQTVDADTYKLRRLHTHPYIAASKNELWTDPQTNLAFRTDLCDYLGDDRKANGRHTIAGVGYYTKTVLNIKVRREGVGGSTAVAMLTVIACKNQTCEESINSRILSSFSILRFTVLPFTFRSETFSPTPPLNNIPP